MLKLIMFYDDSTVCFNLEKGIGESYYLLCPVCDNSGIRVTDWEDGSKEESECALCRRREELMELEMYWE